MSLLKIAVGKLPPSQRSSLEMTRARRKCRWIFVMNWAVAWSSSLDPYSLSRKSLRTKTTIHCNIVRPHAWCGFCCIKIRLIWEQHPPLHTTDTSSPFLSVFTHKKPATNLHSELNQISFTPESTNAENVNMLVNQPFVARCASPLNLRALLSLQFVRLFTSETSWWHFLPNPTFLMIPVLEFRGQVIRRE